METKKEYEQKLKRYFRDNPDLREALRYDRSPADNMEADEPGSTLDDDPGITDYGAFKARIRDMTLKAIEKVELKRKRRRKTGYAVAVAAVALALFCSFTPPGQALAKNTYDLFIKVVDGIMHINPVNDGMGNEPVEFRQVEPASFTDIAEAAAHVNEALVYVHSDDAVVESITVDSTETFNIVTTFYILPGNKRFSIVQTYFSGYNWGSGLDIGNSEPYEYTLLNGQTMYCAYTHEGYPIGVVFWENIELIIGSDSMQWDELEKYLENLW